MDDQTDTTWSILPHTNMERGWNRKLQHGPSLADPWLREKRHTSLCWSWPGIHPQDASQCGGHCASSSIPPPQGSPVSGPSWTSSRKRNNNTGAHAARAQFIQLSIYIFHVAFCILQQLHHQSAIRQGKEFRILHATRAEIQQQHSFTQRDTLTHTENTLHGLHFGALTGMCGLVHWRDWEHRGAPRTQKKERNTHKHTWKPTSTHTHIYITGYQHPVLESTTHTHTHTDTQEEQPTQQGQEERVTDNLFHAFVHSIASSGESGSL